MKTRTLAVTVWSAALLAVGAWWPLSYWRSAGFVATVPVGSHREDAGFAVLSGMGKVLVYGSWASRFARRGAFFEPVLAHEYPHPWFGWQWEGGRLWVSLPIGLCAGLIAAGAAWHLGPGWRRRRQAAG